MSYYLYIHNIYLYQHHDTKPNPINIDWLLGLTPTPTNQHESFQCVLSSLARLPGNFPVGHPSKDYFKSSTHLTVELLWNELLKGRCILL